MSVKPQGLLWFSNAVMGVAGALIVYALLAVSLHRQVFPVHGVRIDGDLSHVTRQQIGLIVQQDLTGNIVTVDLDRLQNGFAQLPWVRRVTISRRWPDQLMVHLEEQQAAARWADGGLVNPYGEVFQAASNATLPVLQGPAGSAPQLLRQYAAYRRTLAPLHLKPVQVAMSPRGAWLVNVDSGLVIKLGRDQPNDRLARFVQVYGDLLGQLKSPPRYVDLRYTNGFALRLAAADKQTAKQTARAH